MSPAGRRVGNPTTGEHITFLETAADTAGERFRMDIVIEAGRSGMAGPVHFHPHQEERFHVLAGTPLFSLDGAASTAGAGDVVTVPRGVPHIFGNAGPGELHMISEYRPGLRSIETFFETFFGLAEETGKQRPDLLQSALTLHECRDYFVITSPPPALQRVMFPLMARVARKRGYRPSYPRFSYPG
ncbi:MAG: cupin domain-containing protein [Actinomycetota bacterium]|nr:cupin domain-containing protein [Actinomycetota bacterium]